MKLITRKTVLGLALASAASVSLAQAYPSKTITVIAPFAAGGSADGLARVVARELSAALGQPAVVENKPGAGGVTGLLTVSKAAPDGYTIGMGATGAVSIGPHLPDAPPLSPQKQLQPLAKIADIPLVIATGSKSGINTLQDLLARGKKQETPLGNAGQFTAHHLSAELLASTTKAQLTSVPYRGSAPAVTDLMGGQLPAAVVDLTSVAEHIKAGTIKALAVTNNQRYKLAPDIPTAAEAGVPGYGTSAWMGLFAPVGMPVEVVEKLSAALKTAMEKPEVQAQILRLSAEPSFMGAQQFTAYLNKESQQWATVIAHLPKPQR